MNLFRATIAPIAGGAPFFSSIVVTGSHEASVAAVAEGQAGSGVDRLRELRAFARGRPELIERVAIVAESPLSPSLPFIASAAPSAADDRWRCARRCLPRWPTRTSPRRARRSASRARASLTPADYDRVIEIEREAAATGYARLA